MKTAIHFWLQKYSINLFEHINQNTGINVLIRSKCDLIEEAFSGFCTYPFPCLVLTETVILCGAESSTSVPTTSGAASETPTAATSTATSGSLTTGEPTSANTGSSNTAPTISASTVDQEIPPEGLSPGAIAGITIGTIAGVGALGEC